MEVQGEARKPRCKLSKLKMMTIEAQDTGKTAPQHKLLNLCHLIFLNSWNLFRALSLNVARKWQEWSGAPLLQ